MKASFRLHFVRFIEHNIENLHIRVAGEHTSGQELCGRCFPWVDADRQ